MIKPLELGICKITFSHQYDSEVVLNKKKHVTEVVRKPVSTMVTMQANTETTIAKAICSPRDQFTYEKGRKEALKKAFSGMKTLTKEDRRRVWDEYRKLKTGGRW